ncbi:MAG: ABC transporter ATP-binding protein/permease [Candidatus Thiodiazotropha sp. (ex Ctena orbiculata)]|nr:ABC transporter ATP-binding protein/permease [Candidatus Thiodiazotropha taylori]
MDNSKPKSHPPGLWALVAPVKGRIYLSMGLAGLAAVCALLAAGTLALVVQALLEPGSVVLVGYLTHADDLVLTTLAFIALSVMLRSVAFAVSHRAGFALDLELRTRLADHLAKLLLGEVLSQPSGALKKILLDDVRGLHVFVADSAPFMGRSIASPLTTVILLFAIDWRLALAAIGVFVLGFAFMRLAMRDFETLRERYDSGNERINGAVLEFVQAMPVVRTFDTGSGTFNRYHEALNHFRETLANWLSATALPLRGAFIVMSPLVTLFAVSIVGIVLYANGLVSFPVLMAFWLLSTGLAESLLPFMWLMNMNRMAEIGAIRINEFLAAQTLPEPRRSETPRDASMHFDRVGFCYPNRSEPALADVSFSATPGSVTALVGPSGGGKSTCARLIPRFFDVTEGAVQVGGVDVRDCDPDTLMHNVAFVFQDAYLFHTSIRENIRMARPEASDEEVQEAARKAVAHDLIMALPQGYDAVAGDRGTRLSGGQRQRITIARALLQDAPILVLDEATSFADPENELQIVAALGRLMQGRTVIIIAHRLSTIKSVDNIVVLDRGRVVEQGRHQQLLDGDGLYARLWRNHCQAQDWSLRQPQPDETYEAASDAQSI